MKGLNFNTVFVLLATLFLGLVSVCNAAELHRRANYLASCVNISVGQYDAVLRARCRGAFNIFYDTSLDLNTW